MLRTLPESRHGRQDTTANTENLGPVFLGIDRAIFSLSTIIVVPRLYTRLRITRNFGWDHITIALTQVLEKHLSVGFEEVLTCSS